MPTRVTDPEGRTTDYPKGSKSEVIEGALIVQDSSENDVVSIAQGYWSKVEHFSDQREAYPYKTGDVLVLGPETFVSLDGKVLSHRGKNYVPQDS